MKAYCKILLEQVHLDGGDMRLFAKGHHAPADFTAACEEWGDNAARPDAVKQGWWRTVPNGDGVSDFLYIPAVPHSRGAFPVTYQVW